MVFAVGTYMKRKQDVIQKRKADSAGWAVPGSLNMNVSLQ